jgi:hypothetical protein
MPCNTWYTPKHTIPTGSTPGSKKSKVYYRSLVRVVKNNDITSTNIMTLNILLWFILMNTILVVARAALVSHLMRHYLDSTHGSISTTRSCRRKYSKLLQPKRNFAMTLWQSLPSSSKTTSGPSMPKFRQGPKLFMNRRQEEVEPLPNVATVECSSNSGIVTINDVDPGIVSKFKVVTCMSTSCTKRRRQLFQDDHTTFSAFWELINDNGTNDRGATSALNNLPHYMNNNKLIQLEETTCLGSCKYAPCVAIEHDDYDGPVSLLGMSDKEFQSRTFHSIVDEHDIRRVWSCLENAICSMKEEEEADI